VGGIGITRSGPEGSDNRKSRCRKSGVQVFCTANSVGEVVQPVKKKGRKGEKVGQPKQQKQKKKKKKKKKKKPKNTQQTNQKKKKTNPTVDWKKGGQGCKKNQKLSGGFAEPPWPKQRELTQGGGGS